MKLKIFFFVLFIFAIHGFSQQSDFKHINFKKADSIASLYKGETLHNLPLLSYKLTYRLTTDVEKFRAIYFWVCHNITSDYKQTNKTLKKGKKYRDNQEAFLAWNQAHKALFFKRLLKDKKTICTGYAFLVKELCALAKIDCKIINGYTKMAKFNPQKLFPNHSWNAVKLNNKWYVCDATLASGYYYVSINTFIYDYNDGYFLTDPNLFIQNHYPEDETWKLTTDKNHNIEYFIKTPFIYGETYKHKITPKLPNELVTKVMVNKNIPFVFLIDAYSNMNKITLVQNNGWKEIEIPIETFTFKNGTLKFNHMIRKKGIYDIHIKLNDEIIASYNINVFKNTIL